MQSLDEWLRQAKETHAAIDKRLAEIEECVSNLTKATDKIAKTQRVVGGLISQLQEETRVLLRLTGYKSLND